MKSVTAFLYIESPETEKLVLESVKSFKSVELLESVSDKFSFLERARTYNPDLMFIEFTNQVDTHLDLFDLITKPIFSIAICDDPSHTNKFLDKGFFDVVSTPISKEQLTKKIYKAMKMSSDIVQRFKGVSIVASPPHQYSKTKKERSKTLNNCVYLKYKSTRVKVPYDDIVYVSNIKELLVIYTETGKKIYHQNSLKKFMLQLPETKFIRISNTTAVNFHKIDSRSEERRVG